MKQKTQKRPAASEPRALEINLYDEVTSWVTRSIVEQLQAAPDAPVTLRINSPGGDVGEGFALASALRTHRGRKVAVIEGVCASAATFPACACDELHMHPESLLMVHQPWGGTAGDAEEIEKYAAVLRQMRDLMANLYQRKTGADEATVRAWMDAETWMTPAQAKEAGFCDVILTDAPAPSARASAWRFAALLKLPRGGGTPIKNTRNKMDETMREKLAKHGLAEDGGNLQEAYNRYMSETEEGPEERKEMAKAVEEMKKPSETEPEPDGDDKDGKALARIYERQLAALSKRVQVAESVAAKVAAETEARTKKEYEAKLASFRKEMLESAEARYLPEQAADLDQLIADVGGDLDKARVHALRMPPVAAFKRLTQGGNPVGLTSVPPPGISSMSRTAKGYSFNKAVAELRAKEPGLSFELAQQRVYAEQPDLYDGAL